MGFPDATMMMQGQVPFRGSAGGVGLAAAPASANLFSSIIVPDASGMPHESDSTVSASPAVAWVLEAAWDERSCLPCCREGR